MGAGDFNDDGKDDLAIGIPGKSINGRANAGAVSVLYGSSRGITSANDQVWHQNSSNIREVAQAGDLFGTSLGVGDFNGDGKDDLAIGVSGERVNSKISAGAVNVLYGSNRGLNSRNNQIWHQDRPKVKNSANPGDLFGISLGVGDFNHDGFDDLAIGIVGEQINSLPNSGAIQILYGSSRGLSA